jgi:hypothetical protein
MKELIKLFDSLIIIKYSRSIKFSNYYVVLLYLLWKKKGLIYFNMKLIFRVGITWQILVVLRNLLLYKFKFM